MDSYSIILSYISALNLTILPKTPPAVNYDTRGWPVSYDIIIWILQLLF